MAYKNDSYVNSPKLLNLQVSKHHCGQGSIFPAKFQECVITVTVLDIVIRSGELTVRRWRTVNTMISPPEGEKVSLTAVVPSLGLLQLFQVFLIWMKEDRHIKKLFGKM